MNAKPFLIAGGGIAGLAASLGLAGLGLPARVFEQSPGFEEVGAGLQMSPNAVRALQALGAWDAVAPHCVIPTEIHVRDGETARLLQRVALGKDFAERFGAPYRVAHRADLLAGLLQVAHARSTIELQTNATVTAAHSTIDGATLGLKDGTRHEGAAVIGADGIRSAIRMGMLAGSEPRPLGHTLYRALVPFEKLPAAIVPDAVTLWLLPGAHVVHYAVSNWRQFNIVATVEELWPGESWSAPGSSEDLLARLVTAHDDLANLLRQPASWLKWRGADIPPQDRWSDGNIAIIGDAAHATLPYLAQGAAMSLEDAVVIARAISRAEAVPAALADFTRARKARCARIQNESRSLGRIYHATGIHRLARNAVLAVMPERRFLQRLSWIYNWRP